MTRKLSSLALLFFFFSSAFGGRHVSAQLAAAFYPQAMSSCRDVGGSGIEKRGACLALAESCFLIDEELEESGFRTARLWEGAIPQNRLRSRTAEVAAAEVATAKAPKASDAVNGLVFDVERAIHESWMEIEYNRPRQRSELATVSRMDDYWQYYSDCDRWGIVFASLRPERGCLAEESALVEFVHGWAEGFVGDFVWEDAGSWLASKAEQIVTLVERAEIASSWRITSPRPDARQLEERREGVRREKEQRTARAWLASGCRWLSDELADVAVRLGDEVSVAREDDTTSLK